MRLAPAVAVLVLAACPHQAGPPAHNELQDQAQKYIDDYSAEYQKLYYAASLAEWTSETHIVANDDTAEKRTQEAEEALAAFEGSAENIETTRKLLAQKDKLLPLQIRQLDRILFLAGSNPQTVADLVKQRIAADTAQTKQLYGYAFHIDGKEVTPNDIDEILKHEKDPAKRHKAWEAAKEIGPTLKAGLVTLRGLRNQTVQALGYHDYFTYMISEYGMTTEEMMALVAQINHELRPLYRELHTWVRYELAKRYGLPVPDLIPADWLPNRWGQDWGDIVTVEGLDLDAAIKQRGAEWVVPEAERFYVSLGFPPLPKSFYDNSSLYPVPAGADYKKNTHASAWHLDLDHDIRSLMSVEPNTEWYETTHHELGHIYYYLSYTNPDVPVLLRQGANRAFHEGIGSLMGMASMQPRFLQTVGVTPQGAKPDPMQELLREALTQVPFMPFSIGAMTQWEHDIYVDDLPPEQWNARWWQLAAQYQGMAPPEARGEEWCDACTKTHINDDPAGYYDYSLSVVILFALHQHIARDILHQDPHDTSYYGSKEVGDFMRTLLRPGATVDWRDLLKDATGQGISAQAMVDYFDPLMVWLKEQNKGRTYTLPDL